MVRNVSVQQYIPHRTRTTAVRWKVKQLLYHEFFLKNWLESSAPEEIFGRPQNLDLEAILYFLQKGRGAHPVIKLQDQNIPMSRSLVVLCHSWSHELAESQLAMWTKIYISLDVGESSTGDIRISEPKCCVDSRG